MAGTTLHWNSHMRRLSAALVRGTVCRAVVLSIAAVLAASSSARVQAIEMFTYFGDGSRIGLPSLEVPIEAYPGIPLRSDRIRARNRAMQMQRGAPPQPGQVLRPASGITIRTMPQLEQQAVPIAPEPK